MKYPFRALFLFWDILVFDIQFFACEVFTQFFYIPYTFTLSSSIFLLITTIYEKQLPNSFFSVPPLQGGGSVFVSASRFHKILINLLFLSVGFKCLGICHERILWNLLLFSELNFLLINFMIFPTFFKRWLSKNLI